MSVKQILACSTTHYLLTKMHSCFLSLGRCRFCQQSLVVKMGDAPAGLQPIAGHKPLPLHTYTDGQSWRKSRSKSQAERETHTEVSITTEGSHGACFCRPPVQCLVKHASEGHLALILNSIMSDHSVLYSVCICEPSLWRIRSKKLQLISSWRRAPSEAFKRCEICREAFHDAPLPLTDVQSPSIQMTLREDIWL